MSAPDVFRHPNPRAPDTREEEDLLLAELAYSPMFRRFIEFVLAPRIKEIRDQLLRNATLDDADRRGYVKYLAELEKMLETVFSKTEAGVMPAIILGMFH